METPDFSKLKQETMRNVDMTTPARHLRRKTRGETNAQG